MGLDLANYEEAAREATMAFWGNRQKAIEAQREAGRIDQGGRAGVTAGKNMDGFLVLLADLVEANGLPRTSIHRDKRAVVLPGYFRPTKQWDVLVVHRGHLVAALELKSQVGPSFGNNFNNRTEEAIGTAHDLWTAYREGAFGEQAKPFVGWLMMVEDEPASRGPVRNAAPHFNVFPEFDGASYLQRSDVLCQRLAKEQLYTAAGLMASKKTAVDDGEYCGLSELTSLRNFVATFAGHIATEAARFR